jgi:hypothetical protein
MPVALTIASYSASLELIRDATRAIPVAAIVVRIARVRFCPVS